MSVYVVSFLSQPNCSGTHVGLAAPIGSSLQKYFAHSFDNFRLLATVSLTPVSLASYRRSVSSTGLVKPFTAKNSCVIYCARNKA